ncbi:UDP-N-acetylglucosamine transporter [Cladophialophora carrionii]|uniref:UDP-N-acetylglucosamine transporter n=1 Tax=Cladophialophora carrionii TaxID=86049 RepID=A0A1C1CJP3_9EURO|nr:UDP-N-acetylglucosamine transporter [Cladophialophora carrionii]
MASKDALSTIYGVPTKYASLLTLVVQNSSLVLLMRYSRILPGPRYLSSTAVVLSEVLKCLICLSVHITEQRHQYRYSQLPSLSDESNPSASQPGYSLKHLWSDIFSVKSGFFKLLVPAVLYTLQNNLQFVAATNLDAATFQVTYQCKILTTALFAVLMLGQTLSAKKWLSLVILTAGVSCVQIPGGTTKTTAQQGNYMVGILAVAVACVCSGFAGVYFEKVLKNGQSSSIWVRNIQLSVGCLGIALFGTFVWDGQAIREHGFFQGYSPVVFATVCVQAAGGLIVAMVIKYADNILKGFATSLSIILSTVASVFIFNFVPTVYFLFGSILVFLATYLYSMPDSPKPVESTRVDMAEKNPILVIDDYDDREGLGLKNIPKPFRDESDPESGDEMSRDSISVYEPDDGTYSRNFSPSLIGTPRTDKQPELDYVS